MSVKTRPGPAETVGPYDLLAKLGGGSMGTVYKARHAVSGETVALKLLTAGAARDPVLRRRFEQEFEAVQLIDHPNVVRALEFAAHGTPAPYLVMELVDGESLADIIEREGPLPEARAVPLVLQIGEALHAALSTTEVRG